MVAGIATAVFSSHAAPLAWTDTTVSGPTPMNNNATLTSFTTSAGTFSSFTFFQSYTVQSVGDGIHTDGYSNYWSYNGSEVDGVAALASARLDAGLLNIGTIDFDFETAVGTSDWFFLSDSVGSTESITIRPLDASGNLIGSYSLTLDTSTWGLGESLSNPDFTGTNQWLLDHGADENNQTVNNNVASIVGITFQLSDFTGDSISLDGVVQGIRIEGGGAFDPSVVGLASIPEPSTTAILLGLTMLGLTCVRRKRA